MRHLRLVHSDAWSERSNARSPAAVDDCPLDPEIRAIVEHVRAILPLPRAVRARALARARAAIAAATSSPYMTASSRSRDHHR